MSKPVKSRKSYYYEDSEGWAVSYSDLLMVLMSFFIIYFNLDAATTTPVQKLAFELMENDTLKNQNFSVNPNREIANTDSEITKGLNVAFNNAKKLEKPIYKEFTIDLPPDLYATGNYELTKKASEKLKTVFNLIDKYKADIDIYFIGHTDSLKFKKNTEVINSNLILSSMRAARAVEYAIGQGFDENQVFVQGLKGRPRNTRSLSLRLVAR